MSLRTKTLIAVFAVCLLLLVFVYSISSAIIGRSFYDLEQQNARRDMERVTNALQDEIAALSRTNRDYAAWDDSYAFVASKLPDYVQSNLADETFVANRFSFVMFVTTDRSVVFAKAFDLATGQAEPVDTMLGNVPIPSDQLLDLPTIDSSATGIFMLPQGPMIITARPITNSTLTAPINGTLIIGRLLDAQAIARLAETTRLNLTIDRLDQQPLPALVIELRGQMTPQQPTIIHPLTNQQLVIAEMQNDIMGQPAVMLQVTSTRDVFNRGQEAIRYVALALVLVGLVLSTIVMLLLDRFVLRRLTKLGANVSVIGVGGALSARVITDGNDEISVLASNINHMLSALEASQTQLQISEMRFRQLFEVAPEPIIVHDGVVVHFCNPAAATLLGEPVTARCVGMQLCQFAPTPAHLAHSHQPIPTWREDIFMRQTSDRVHVEYLAVPLPYEHDHMTLLIVRDITIRKQTELALQSAKEFADEANKAKSQFLATMSHELRTPLTAILGYTELIEMDVYNNLPRVLPDLERIRQSGKHLLTLINDVLDLSRIEAGHMSLYPELFRFHTLMHDVVGTVTPLANKNGNTITLQIPETLAPLYTDQTKVRQIILNVVHNACKFTHNGQITIIADQLADNLIVHVIDTGIGMSPKHLSQLFQEFKQADSSTTRIYGGTGLGLALSRRLCRLLGGDITVISALDAGSTFLISLPIKLADQLAIGEESSTTEPMLHGPDAPDAQHVRIALLIYSDPVVRESLAGQLHELGLIVESCDTNKGGFEMAQALLPDIILISNDSPDQDGWSIIEALQADPETAPIPVLVDTITADQAYQHDVLLREIQAALYRSA